MESPIVETLVRELLKQQEQFKVETIEGLSAVRQKVDDLYLDLKGEHGRIPKLEAKVESVSDKVSHQRGHVMIMAGLVSAIILALYKIIG